jgi:beta-phosphoglucomutase
MRANVFDFVKAHEAVIFDLDGVLVDTAIYHFQAWKRLANELGFDFTHEENEQLKGVSRMQSLEKILHWGKVRIPEDGKHKLAAQKNEWYLEYVQQMDQEGLLPGAAALLQWLKANGYKVALGSASKNAQLILRQTGITHFFDCVIDGNAVSESKPDPTVFLRAARGLGVEPRNCVVFEDAQSGIDAARAAEMSVVGVGMGLVHADFLIDGLDEVLI